MHRFYLPDLGDAGGASPLPAEEARHLTRVLRLSEGAAVRVFDGRGREHDAVVETLTRGGAVVRVGGRVEAAPEPGVRVTLAQALLKGDKFDEVVRDLTMLGVWSIQPIVSARVEAPGAGRGGRVDRWRRIAINAAKQSGRAVVPEVDEPARLETWLAHATRPVILLAEPATHVAADPIPARPSAATIVVGPEGGWSTEEVALATTLGARVVRIGGRTLRADAVALVALAVLLHQWDAF